MSRSPSSAAAPEAPSHAAPVEEQTVAASPARQPRRLSTVLLAAACTTLLTLAGPTGTARAQTAESPVIYPAKGRSGVQQDRDKYACHDWARGQSGFDPLQTPQSPAKAGSAPSTSGSAAGMARSAMGGAGSVAVAA